MRNTMPGVIRWEPNPYQNIEMKVITGHLTDEELFVARTTRTMVLYKLPMNEVQSHSQADDNKITRLKGQVNEVKGIMKDNIEKVIDGMEKAQYLSDRTENLAVTSTRFKDSAVDLRKHTQRRNWKIMCCIVCVVVVVLAVVAVVVLYALKII